MIKTFRYFPYHQDLICDECLKVFIDGTWEYRLDPHKERALVKEACEKYGWLHVLPPDRIKEYHFCSNECRIKYLTKLKNHETK